MKQFAVHLLKTLGVYTIAIALLVTPLFFAERVTAQGWEAAFDRRKSEVEGKLNAVNSTVNEYKKDIEDLKGQQATLSAQIQTLQGQIAKKESLIQETKTELQKTEIEIDNNTKEIEKLKKEIKLIFVDIQSNQVGSLMEVLFSSKNLDEMLGKINALDTLQTRLNILRKQTEDKIKELNANKELLTQTQATLSNTQAIQSSKKSDLASLLDQTKGEQSKYEELVKGLAQQEAQFRAEISQISADKQAEADRRAAEAERIRLGNGPRGSGRDPGDGDYNACNRVNEAIPLPASDFPDSSYFGNPTSGIITSGFGCPEGYTYFDGSHDGIDIANGEGAEIRSIAQGVVDWARFRYGWGNTVVIRHDLPSGRKVYSGYFHLSSISVSVGEQVAKGQRIGGMGGTAFSPDRPTYGIHLHVMIMDETYEVTRVPACGKWFANSRTYCYNPFLTPFRLY
jgi:murein DD-endopeptidase MepM/ murein hydrolase activator NlpD